MQRNLLCPVWALLSRTFQKLSFQKLQQSHTSGPQGRKCPPQLGRRMPGNPVITLFVLFLLGLNLRNSHTYRRPCVRFLKHSQLSVWMLWQAQGSGQGRRHAVATRSTADAWKSVMRVGLFVIVVTHFCGGCLEIRTRPSCARICLGRAVIWRMP